MGWPVSRSTDPGGAVPKAGAIIHNFAFGSGLNRFGHVGVVEVVHPDGSLTISDMNWVGWNQVSWRHIDAHRARWFFNYIYW